MSTDPQRTCSNCGNGFSGALEFCAVCMLRKALSTYGRGCEPLAGTYSILDLVAKGREEDDLPFRSSSGARQSRK